MDGVLVSRRVRTRRQVSKLMAVFVASSVGGYLSVTADVAHSVVTATVSPWEAPTIADTSYIVPAGAMFVAPTGRDTNPGTQAAPFATITKALARAKAGATIVLRGGTYRQSLGVIKLGVTLQAYPHEQPWIKGSIVAGSFTASSGAWSRAWTTTTCNNCYPSGVIDPLFPNAGMADQVFIDGVPQAQVSTRAALKPGAFFMDRSAKKLWLGSNPNAHTVEVTVLDRAVLVNSAATATAFKGLGFAHFAAHYNSDVPAMVVATAANMKFDKNTFAWSASRGLSFYGANNVLTDNTFINNGMNGVHSFQTTNTMFKRNRVAYSNFERFSIAPSSQGSVGGAKMTMADRGHYEANIFEDNMSNALWIDVSSSNNVVVNNTFVRNAGHGFDIEVSANTIVAGNVIAANGRDGLKISGANNVEAWNNTIFANGWAQVGVYEDPRQHPPAAIASRGITWDTSNVRLMNNVIVAGPYSSRPVLNSFDLTSPKHATTQSMITAQDNNVWGRTNVAGMKYLATVQATLTANARYNDLTGMQAATRRETRSRSADNLPISKIFVNFGAGNLSLAATAPKPTPARLPASVATNMGVATTVATIGALKAPVA